MSVYKQYAFDSTESANTQCRTSKDIVELATLFPGLRMYLLHAKCMEKATSMNLILALWCRLTGPPDEEWSFWQTLAAVCLSDATISTILEESSITHLTSSKKESLSVIERLLVEHSCS
jgi:hypothetical protein